MSSSLYWAPPPEERKDHHVDLKYEIGKYLDDEYRGESIQSSLTSDDIPFLKGIMAVGGKSQVTSANELIQAIKKYGHIDIFTRS